VTAARRETFVRCYGEATDEESVDPRGFPPARP
jgi:hypothetical protein